MPTLRPSGPIARDEMLALVASLLKELGSQRALDALRLEAMLERDLGLGSLERVELVSRIELHFGKAMPESTIGLADTVEDLLRIASVAPLASKSSPVTLQTSSESVERRLGPSHGANNLAELLQWRAESEPHRVHLFLKEDDQEEKEVSFSQLYRDSLKVAAGLSAHGIERGETVSIMLPTCYDFFCVFMATQILGAVPVPLYPPLSTNRLEEYSHKQAAILRNARARVFVTLDKGRSIGELLRSAVPSLEAVVSTAELRGSGDYSRPVSVGGGEPALIQYTSGSTGDPKGVLLAHRNLLANLRVIGEALDVQPDDVGVSWLPLYHDMGLIGAWLMPLYFGIPVSIFSPIGFLSRPDRWLWAIHTRRATLSAAPNFAYELATRKVSDDTVDALDLSCWRAALNGAEPIARPTLDRFVARFSTCGFDARSMMPVYGLAENSLLLSAPPLRRGYRALRVSRAAFESQARVVPAPADASDANSLEFISTGQVASGHEIHVLDETGKRLPEGWEGRLCFRGPSMMQGYYRNDDATAAITTAEGLLDSGDRGFVWDGEVFVTGRAKDLIIRAGRNIAPHDLEYALSSIEGLKKGAIVAFGVPDVGAGTERLVVVAEVALASTLDNEAGREALEASIRQRLSDSHGLLPDEVALLAPRTIPKTSSGKLRRGACRKRYLANELSEARPAFGFMARLGWASFLAKYRKAQTRLLGVLYAAYVYVLSAFAAGLLWLLSLMVPKGRPFRSIVSRVARLYLKASGIRVSMEEENILDRAPRPLVIVMNHASYLDPLPVIANLPLDFAFVVKGESESWPFIGRVIRRMEHLFVERMDVEASAASTREMSRILNEGRSVVIFPEGTFSSSAGVRPFKMGAFQLASQARVPVLPVALVGTRRWLRDGSFRPRRGEIRLRFGSLHAPGAGFTDIAQQRQQIAEEIASLAGEPRLDLVAAGYQPDSRC